MKSRILTFGYRIALIALVSLWLAAGDSKAQLGRQELPHALTTRALSPHFEHLSIEDGLSQLSVYSMHQDSRGFIWIGTQDGLNRYDGYEFKIYRHAPYDSASLTQGWVWDIKEDPAGNIWAVTHTGVSRIDAITGLVTRHLNEPNEWVFTTLEIDRNGTVWVGSSGDGLFAIPYDDVDGVIHYVADRDSDETISANRVGAMLEDTRGRILVDVFDDDNTWLNIIDPDRPGIFERRPVADSLRGVWHERPEEPGIFWAGVRPGRMMRIDLNAEEHVVYDLEPGNELDITSIEQDPNNPNILWLAIDGGGLGRFDIRSGAFSRYRAERDNPNSLSSNTATELLVDRSGIIWVGTHLSGVDRFNPASIGFEHIREDLNGEIGLAASSVWAIYQTRDGVVWASTQDDENNYFLSRIDRERGASTHFSAVDDDPNRVPTGAISGMLEDDEGRLWLATSQGLGIIDRQTGRFTAMGPTERLRACCLVQSQTGAIWYRGGTDLIKIEQDGRYELTMGGLSNVSWGDIKEDQAGYLWTAEFDLRKFDPVTGKSEVIDLNPSADLTASLAPILSLQFSRSEQNILWFATFGAGLGRLDTRSGDVRYLTVRDGLPNDALYAVLEDDSGRLWFSSNRGLTRYNPRTGEIRNYGTEIGLQSLEFNTWAGHRGPFGELFFGGPNGLNAFFPNALTENDTPPEVSIVDLKLSNKSVRETGEIVLDRPLEETEAVTLRYEQNDLTLDFVAFHYQHSDLNRFAYKLEGFNDDWIDAGDQRSATYTNLAPGEYTFQVKAANSDGVWNEEGTSLRVIVLPPWWRSWWAYLVYGLVLAAGVFGVDRTQRARLIRKENERAREKELEHAKEIESAYNELRSTQDRLIQSEKMASLGQLTAGIAHEIKNPLNFVNNFSDVTAELADELAAEVKSLKAELPPDRLDEVESILASLSMNAKKIGEHGKRADGIVQNMLEHSKFGEGERAPTDINNLLDEYATLALHGFKARNGDFEIAVERDLDQSIGRINIVPQEMGRVFMNLIGNAFDALRESNVERRTSNVGAVVTVSTSRKDGHVEIRISDNGPGIPDNLKSKIFEPFFTTKPTGSGTGLGLSMSYDIVTKGHGGQLDVESVEGNGATFIITLPT